jgi:cyanate permease
MAWGVCAGLLLLAFLLCALFVPPVPRPARGTRPAMRAQFAALVAARRPLRVAACFAAYNIVYFGIAAFLPAFLESRGAGTGIAGGAAALAALANLAGNLAAAALMRRGAAPERLVILGSLAMGAAAAGVFLLASPEAAGVLALLACAVGGLVPAACFALVPSSVPEPALVAPAMGLTIQGNNLMQLLAPPMLGALAGLAWPLLAPPMLGAALVAAWLARGLNGPRLRPAAPAP